MTDRRFTQSIDYLEDLYHHPLLPANQVGLARAAALLEQLGNPHLTFRSVHVAGSSGKGSTTTLVGSILQAAGFRTGYFRSPHLVSYTERIAVDGVDISREMWARHWNRIHPVVDAMRANNLPGYRLGRPALFEVLFALMAVHFQQAGVEWAAVETGLGGRLDATNLLRPDVAVVTNVSLEHTQILGDTVAAIAHEKAAIIKAGSHAVTASEDPAALEVIRNRAQQVGAPLLEVGRDVTIHLRNERVDGQRVSLRGKSGEIEVELPLAGEFQAINAATVFGAALSLRRRGIALSDAEIIKGLESVHMAGRFEMLSSEPMIILDGAHNPAAAHELRRTAERLLAGRRIVLLMATMADKDVATMAAELGPLADRVIVTCAPSTNRAAAPSRLVDAFRPWSSSVAAEEDVHLALSRALREVDANSVLLVTGSLYLVGQVREAYRAVLQT